MNVWRIFWLTMIAMAVASGILALVTLPAPAQAVACGPTESLLRQVRERFGEEPHMTMKAGGATFLLTLSDDGSWTLLRLEGIQACVMVSGTGAKREAGT